MTATNKPNIVPPEGMLKACEADQWHPSNRETLGRTLTVALQWLDDILHEGNVDFYCAILKRARERYPGADTDGQIGLRRVDFEFGVSFARHYIRDLFHAAEPAIPEAIADLIAKWDIEPSTETQRDLIIAFNRGREAGPR